MAIVWIDPVDIKPNATGVWRDVDVSAYVPDETQGVIFHITRSSTTTGTAFGFRCNGSTDNRPYACPGANWQTWQCVGVDANRIFEIYLGSLTIYPTVTLVGYFHNESNFKVNAVDVTPSGTDAWNDCDISGQTGTIPAIAAIFEVYSGASLNAEWGIRKNGSSDNRYVGGIDGRMGSYLVGLDANQICENWRNSTNCKLYLTGYMVSEISCYTNAVDVSIGSSGSWVDLTALPSAASGGFIEVYKGDAGYNYFNLRKKGTAWDYYKYNNRHPQAMVGCDANYIIEGKIGSTSVDFFLMAYSFTIVNASSSPPVESEFSFTLASETIGIDSLKRSVIILLASAFSFETCLNTRTTAFKHSNKQSYKCYKDNEFELSKNKTFEKYGVDL